MLKIMDQHLDDRSRFAKVLNLLPEEFIDNFIRYYLDNAYYPKEINEILSEYIAYKQSLLSEFSNSKINESYAQLNKSFDILTKFLFEYFWTPADQYKMYKNPPFFYLKPDIHHNFGGENKNPILWDKYKRNLDKIANEFRTAYNDFIKVVKTEVEQKEEILKIFPEFHGVGINLVSLFRKIRYWF